MSKSKVFFYLCLSFIIGVFTASLIKINFIIILLFLVSGVFFLSLFWENKKAVVFGLCLVFLSLGFFQTKSVQDKIINNKFEYGNNIVLEGIILKDPELRGRYARILVGDSYGKVLINASRYPEYEYNDRIRFEGKIEAPPVFEDFNYRDYLLKDGIYAVMSYPKIELLDKDYNKGVWPFIYSNVLSFKSRLRQSIQNNFSIPYSSILEGMILGDNSAMDNDLKNKLNITGLRHIIAISGSHIVIISSILMSFFLMLGLWRSHAFYASVIFISLFIILSGFPASGVRAAIMGGIFLLAQKTGRKNESSRTIVMAAAVMLFFNPLLLLYDVGFQLSFLASMGIIHFSPVINRKIGFLKGELKNMVSMTFSAQIFTLPILVYNFGSISLVSFITNILILPATYLIMIFGFVSNLLGMISDILGWIFSLPLWLLLTYFIKVMDLFSGPWAAKTIENAHWSWVVISYLLLFFLVRYLKKREKLRFLNY